MNKRTLTRAQAWGGVALRENSNTAWKKGMKLAEKYYRGAHDNTNSNKRTILIPMRA